MAHYLTTNQCAARLGIQPQSVRALITRGQLKARQFGRSLLVDERELNRYIAVRRPPGRPVGSTTE